jgi:hypothetical protein
VIKPTSDSSLKACRYSFALVDDKALAAHENVDVDRVAELTREIARDGVIKYPIIVDINSMVILDGHHRVRALMALGCHFIPAYLLDYYNDTIVVTNWGNSLAENRRDGSDDAAASPITKDRVIVAGLTGRLLPPKTSRHLWPWPYEQRPVSIAVLKNLTASVVS